MRDASGIAIETISERPIGANAAPDASFAMPGRMNFLVGKDRAKWTTGLESYRLAIYRDAWPGVDLRVHGLGERLEQEYVVRPASWSAR